MEAKKKRVMTKPLSSLQQNCLKQGRMLFEFNGIIHRLDRRCYDIEALLTDKEKLTMHTLAGALATIKDDVMRRLRTQQYKIIESEIAQGLRCPQCNSTGNKLSTPKYSYGALYTTCKKCKYIWEVTK